MDNMICTRLECVDMKRICEDCEYYKAVYDPKIYKLVPVGEKSEPCKEAEPWTRQRVLKEAEKCVCGKREQNYGTPEDNFRKIGDLWSTYLECNVKIDAYDVAAMMALLKISRLSNNPEHMDSWVDLAGYAACGGEIAAKQEDV